MIKSNEIISAIVSMEASLEPERQELDRLYREFIEAIVPYSENWIEKHVKRVVEENASKLTDAGIDVMRSLKADVSELKSMLNGLCRQAFQPSSAWPHNRTSGGKSAASVEESESHAAAAFRTIVSNLGGVLAHYDLHIGPNKEWESLGGGKYRYKFNPGFDTRDFPVLIEYEKKRIAHQGQLRLLAAARQDLVKARAQELWDQA